MEIAVEGAQLDGMICLSSCDKTPPGHLMAAGRFNIPTILVICGYQPCGAARRRARRHRGRLRRRRAGRVRQARRRPAARAWPTTRSAGRACARAWRPRTRCTSPSRRSGMALPGSAPVRANSPKMIDVARRSGHADRRDGARGPQAARHHDRRRLPQRRRRRARVAGSINCIKHLQATAIESGLDLDVYGLFNELGDDVPVLSAVRPNGEDSIEQFEDAGGAQALLKQLEPVLDTGALTVTGATVARQPRRRGRPRRRGDPAARSPVLRQAARSSSCTARSRPRARSSSSASASPAGSRSFTGPAIVFDDGPAAIAAIHDGDRRARPRARRARAWASRAARAWPAPRR